MLLAIFPAFAIAQDAKEKAEKEEERRQTLQRKAFVLVDEIASGALSLKLPENRSFIIASAAELMWDHDEKRARNLFWDAVNTLNLIVNALPADSGNKKTPKEKEKLLTAYFTNFGMRRELLRKVSRRDPQLAMEIFRATHQPLPENIEANYYFPDERDLEQEIAAEAAARDPKRALEIARESLAKGFTFQLLELLFRLNHRDAELGSKFAGEIIDKLKTRNLSTDHYGSRISVDLLLMSRTSKGAENPGEARRLKLEKEQRRDLVELIGNAALSVSANPNLLYAIDEIMPEFEEFAPERLPLLQKKLAAFNQTLNKEQKGWNEHNALVRGGNPEEMLRGSRQLDEEARRSLQQQAIVMAVFHRRADALREIINNEIEESRRKVLIDSLDAEQINWATNNGNAEELRKLLPQIRLREQRARAMAEMAALMEKNGDHDEAVKLLDEARTLIKLEFDSETQTDALLALVAAYAVVDPSKAFAIIENAVDNANDQISKLALLDRLLKSGAIKSGELRLQQAGILPLDFLVFKYGKGVSALANADFDRTKAAADRFGRNELRLLARLMLARALVVSTYKTPRSVKRG